jgi:H+-transporting ATPase
MAVGTYHLNFEQYEEEDFVPFDPKIKRTEATIRHKSTGETFRVTKGAPQVILAMSKDPSIEAEVSRMVEELAAGGYRTLGVARTNAAGQWQMLGLIPLYDPPREDTAETIQKAILMDVKVKMITGDQTAIAKETARLLKLGDRIYNSDILNEESSAVKKEMLDEILITADGFAEVFPEHKFAIVKMLQERGFRVGMTGDGVNDAPALKKADVGIAVEGATDAARAAADIVLTSPGLSVIIEALYRSRKIFQRMKFYLIYRIACTIQLLIFFFIVMTTLNPKNYDCRHHGDSCDRPNTFSLPVVGLVLITFLNDGTIISIAYDKVSVSKQPDVWNLPVVFVISFVLGLIAFFGSLMLILVGLDHMDDNHPNGFLHAFKIPTWKYGELLTVIWLKVSLQDYLTLFSARCHSFFWERMPSKIVMSASVAATLCSTLLAA